LCIRIVDNQDVGCGGDVVRSLLVSPAHVHSCPRLQCYRGHAGWDGRSKFLRRPILLRSLARNGQQLRQSNCIQRSQRRVQGLWKIVLNYLRKLSCYVSIYHLRHNFVLKLFFEMKNDIFFSFYIFNTIVSIFLSNMSQNKVIAFCF